MNSKEIFPNLGGESKKDLDQYLVPRSANDNESIAAFKAGIDRKQFSKDAIDAISSIRAKYSHLLNEKYNLIGTSDDSNSFIHEKFHSQADSVREKWLDQNDEIELTKIAKTISLLSKDFAEGPGVPTKGYYQKGEVIPTLGQWLDAYENTAREIGI